MTDRPTDYEASIGAEVHYDDAWDDEPPGDVWWVHRRFLYHGARLVASYLTPEAAEYALAGVMSDIPMPPETFDPDWPGAERLRDYLLTAGPSNRFVFVDGDVATGGDVAAARMAKAWGPAPYVGRPFVYLWHVAVDADSGVQIAAGSASIHVLPDGWLSEPA